MYVTLSIADAYRRQRLGDDGAEIDAIVELSLTPAELPAEGRQLLVELSPTVAGELDLSRLWPTGSSDTAWAAALCPASPDEWLGVLRSAAEALRSDRDRRREELIAGARQELARLRQLDGSAIDPSLVASGRPPRAFSPPDVRLKAADLALYQELVDLQTGLHAARATAYASALAAYVARAEEARDRQREREHAEAVAKDAARVAAQAEKTAWIDAHGSDHLRRAVAAGYDCQRRYVTERAAAEFPGYNADIDSVVEWRGRSCPSEAALTEAERVGGIVVWLTVPPTEPGRPDRAQADDDDDYDAYTACEAVVVENYLGRYCLVRLMA